MKLFKNLYDYRELLKTNFIKETNLDDGTQLYQLNLCMPTYSNVLNEDGFFAIGDTIYQITPNQYKIWKNGDINNYQELIEITETDLSKISMFIILMIRKMQLKPVHYFLFII